MNVGINLIPPAMALERHRKRCARLWAKVIVVGVLAVLASLSLDWQLQRVGAEVRASYDECNRQVESVRAAVRNLSTDTTKTTLLLERANALRAKRAWSGLIGLIVEKMPPGCRLKSVATDPPKSEGEQIIPAQMAKIRATAGKESAGTATIDANKTITVDAPRKLKLSGFADDPGLPLAFVAQLKGAGIFKDVTLARAQWQPSGNSPGLHFELVCEW